ncbi:hypothetical protein MVES1_001328 [Malassezia vespertilionis]|uniref:ferric-chelate reductase (NADPH) n=1 Tax=Malassezia vespertilionis TaxID=2020962 RepID=A0A2N1JEK3_9BASI|nr:uncharacterized protein MVES1_001328 [Malassezia vespertilionis]PKI84974.1 hypothetical protein MVES_001246 [Malassezia vespertilionis]WFD05990.1 hypothetical protein MVES1_001328 [Malassezia vespertilionis]
MADAADEKAYGALYLGAHELSGPSERYVYIFWFVLLGLGVVLGMVHYFALTERTVLGVVWGKVAAMHAVGRALYVPTQRTPAPAPRTRLAKYWRSSKRYTLYSLDVGLFGAVLCIVVPLLCLTFIGADYIDPDSDMFAAAASNDGRLQWGRGDYARVMTEKPTGTLPYKTWWTIGSRAGDFCNALTPLAILFALKQAPFALLALPVFGQFAFDTLMHMHKWTAHLLWVYATVHTVAWCIQISNDTAHRPDLWSQLLVVPRFRWAIVAYIFLTLLILSSFGFVRRWNYELFYVVHIVCIVGFMVATWAHHPQLGWWMLAGFVLWGMERLTRLGRVYWINFRSMQWYTPPFSTPAPEPFHPDRFVEYDTAGWKHQSLASLNNSTELVSCASQCSWEQRSDVRGTAHTPYPVLVPFRPALSDALRVQLLPGYAFIQPLAGQMMRLVLRTASPLKWRPGQWLYLHLPKLSWFQSHPFTIASSFVKYKNDLFIPYPDPHADPLRDPDQLIMLLIRARGGLTRRLWEYVEAKVARQAAAQTAQAPPARIFPAKGHGAEAKSEVQGVYLRANVDGPYGTSSRIDWGAFASVFIVVGGSGVAFGISVLDYLCRQIARTLRGADVRGKFGRPFLLRHVRFVWIMREFAHLQWAASALRLCLEMLPPEHLSVQIFVTRVQEEQVAVPQPGVAPSCMQRDEEVQHIHMDRPGLAAHVTGEPWADVLEMDEAGLTELGPEEAGPLSRADREMNAYIMYQGKIQRGEERSSPKWYMRPKRRAAEHSAVYDLSPPGSSTSLLAPESIPMRPLPSLDALSTKPYTSASSILSAAAELPTRPNLDAAEIQDFDVAAKFVHAGYPKLDEMLRADMEQSEGRTLIVSCGPTGLLAIVRAIVAKQIHVCRGIRGDLRAHACVYTESYE